MQKRNLSRTRTRSASPAQAIEFNWQYVLLVAVCGAIVAAGFFFAARQHFMSMDYGFKNSKLKKQLEDLEAEKRRLVLAREVSLSPAEIRKAASRAAALRAAADSTVVLAAATAARPVASPDPVPATSGSASAAKVVRTAFVRPAAQPDASEKNSRSAETVRNDGIEIAAVAKLK